MLSLRTFETPSGPVGPGLVSHERWFLIEVSCQGTFGDINALAWNLCLISRMMIKQDPAKGLAKISDGFVNESQGLKQAGAAVLCFDNIWPTESFMVSTTRRKRDAYYN